MRSCVMLVCALVLPLGAGCGQAAVQGAIETPVAVSAAPMPRLPPPHVEGALSTRQVLAGRDALVTARITIDTRTKTPIARPPIDVVLCMDTSGSMEGKPIDDARRAALSFVDALQPGDGFALVTFDSTVEHVVSPKQIVKADLPDIRARIGKISAKGTTDMASGMQAAFEDSQRIYDATRVNRIVLLGDGVPNDATPIKALAQASASRGVGISTVGLGPDYDEILMGEVAQLSGGRFRYADDSSKVAKFFDEEIVRIAQVSAKGATLELTAGPGVIVTSVIGQEIARVGNVVRVYLGDISLGSQRDLYVRMKTGPHRDGASVELLDAVVRYTAEGVAHEQRVFIGAHATSDSVKLAAEKDLDVEKGAEVAQQAADKIDAIRKAHDSDKAKAPPNVVVNTAGGQKPSAPPMPAPMADPAVNLVMKRDHADAMQTLFQ